METFAMVLVCGTPAIAGYVLARYCSKHCLAISAFIAGLTVLIFASSVPYAAVPLSLMTGISASIGYFVGRAMVPPDEPHRNP